MTALLTYVDAEVALRSWARQEPTLVDVVGTRTFFGLPSGYLPSAKGPAYTVNLIGGVPDPHSPLDLPEVQWDCWGTTKAEAAVLQTVLKAALHNLHRVTVATSTGDVILVDARVTGSLFSPDTSADPVLPRYVVTALVAVLPAA